MVSMLYCTCIFVSVQCTAIAGCLSVDGSSHVRRYDDDCSRLPENKINSIQLMTILYKLMPILRNVWGVELKIMESNDITQLVTVLMSVYYALASKELTRYTFAVVNESNNPINGNTHKYAFLMQQHTAYRRA